MSKIKKIKRKAPNMKRKYTRNKNTTHKIKKTSNKLKTILLVIALFIFVLSAILLDSVLATFITLFFIVFIIFAQILDNNPKNSKYRKRIKALIIIILTLGIISILSFGIFFIYVISQSPTFDVEKLERKEATIIYDNNEDVVAKLGSEKREKVTYEEIPEVLVDAIVATEDSRFFQHNGLDAPRFTKAVLGQLLGNSNAGGGSTLTMQVAKNNFTSTKSSGMEGIVRKFTDIYLSIFKIEKAFTKQEIIEFYVNNTFLGSNSYGVEQASMVYFGKHAKELTLPEASILAGMFQAPSAYDPYYYPESTKTRQKTVLSLMVRHGYITQEQADIAYAIPIEDLLISDTPNTANIYQSYIDMVVAEIEDNTGLDAYTIPMLIYTSMDAEKQQGLNNIFNKTYTWPKEEIQAGVAAIDVNNGRIIAIGGGRYRTGERMFNYATDIQRQIGSAAKPLFDYGPAFEYENWSPAQMIQDAPYTYSDGKTIKNWDGGYKGWITARYALSASRNIPALKTFQANDNKNIIKFVTALGITPEIDANGYIHEAHAIGGFTGTSPVQLAGAYQAFANGGYYYEPHSVNKIVLRGNNESIDFEEEIEKVKVMQDSTAYMITDILRMVASNYGVNSVVKDTIAMKTGTTNYDSETRALYGFPYSAKPDALIAGYSSEISMSLWTGFDKNEKGVYLSMSQMTSHKVALYKECAKVVYSNEGLTFKRPSSVISVKIEKGSNPVALPSSNTPSNMIYSELFRKGTEPTSTSFTYQKLSNVTGLSINYSNETIHLAWNNVNKPTDLDDEEFGDFGYFVYCDDKKIGFTTQNYYDHPNTNQYQNYTIKTAYEDTTTNISSGTEIKIEEPETIIEESEIITTFTFNLPTVLNLNKDETFSPNSNPIKIMNGEIDVTSESTISNTNNVNTSIVGTYNITYTASYNENTESFSQQINVE